MFIELNLPKPSQKIIDKCYEIAEISPLELELKALHDYVQDYKVNSVSRKFVEDNEELKELTYQEYKQFFKEEFIPAVGIVKNLKPGFLACWPPHSDRTRIFALNYYIEEGGDNVLTEMYTTFDNYEAGLGTGKIYRYEDLTKDTTYHLDMNKWYALNVRKVHSIENIKTTRLIYTFSFLNMTYYDFVQNYSSYIVNK